MNTDTGEFITKDIFGKIKIENPKEADKYIMIDTNNTKECPCGSKDTFAKCCFKKIKHLPRREKRKQIRYFFKHGKLIKF